MPVSKDSLHTDLLWTSPNSSNDSSVPFCNLGTALVRLVIDR